MMKKPSKEFRMVMNLKPSSKSISYIMNKSERSSYLPSQCCLTQFYAFISHVCIEDSCMHAYTVKIPAAIDIDPNTLNWISKGRWITCYIELPEGYDVGDIDVSTITLDDTCSGCRSSY